MGREIPKVKSHISPKAVSNKPTADLLNNVSDEVNLIIDKQSKGHKKLINLSKKLLKDKLDFSDSLTLAQLNFKGLSEQQMQEQYGQSGQTNQQVLDYYQELQDRRDNTIIFLDNLLRGEKISKEEVEKYSEIILKSFSEILFSESSYIKKVKRNFNTLSEKEMQNKYGYPDKTKKQILDLAQEKYDSFIKAKDFIEGLLEKIN